MWAQMGQITNTALTNTCGTLRVQLQQLHTCEWQDYDSSQAKQIQYCMLAGIDLDKCASGHEMSNPQWWLPRTSQLHLFALHNLLRTILHPASWWLSQEQFWTTSTVAGLWVARPGWLPSQANLILHVGWHRPRQMCQWPWNVKSTIRKADLPQHKPGSPWENWSLPTASQLHLFCTAWSLPG